MASKQHYYELDEIGFVGTQNKKQADARKDIKLTVNYIKAKKQQGFVRIPKTKKAKKTLSKTTY